MFLLRTFLYYTLTHNNREVRQECTHYTLRSAKVQHFILIHFAILIASKF